MSGDYLEDIEFVSDADQRTPEEYIDLAHDPDLLYYQIKYEYEKAQHGLRVDAGSKEEKVEIYAKVEIFRSVMQYIEEFAIYFLAYTKGRDELIEHLLGTMPREVKNFFTSLSEDAAIEYLQAQDIDHDFSEVLRTVFGYAGIESVEALEDEDYEAVGGGEVDGERLEELKDQSVEQIERQVRAIGNFYLDFEDGYNAVKHGSRVLPQPYSAFQFGHESADGEPEPFELDVQLAIFICKDRDRNAYLLGYPVEYLLDRCLTITESVYQLFSYLKRMAEASINETERPRVTFFGFEQAESESEAKFEEKYVKIWNPSGAFVLPKTDALVEYLPYDPGEVSRERTVAARIKLKGRRVIIETENDEEISPAYPVKTTFWGEDSGSPKPGMIEGVTYNLRVLDVDAVQLMDFLKMVDLLEADNIESVEVEDKENGECFEISSDSFDPPALDEEMLIDRDRLEVLYRLQKATQRRIPAPVRLSERQAEIIDEWIQESPSQDEAHTVIDQLEQAGDEFGYTAVWVDRGDGSGDVQESEFIGELPWQLNIEFEDDTVPKRRATTVATYSYPGSFDDVLDQAKQNPMLIASMVLGRPLNTNARQDKADSSEVSLLYSLDSGFWSTEHRIRLQVSEK